MLAVTTFHPASYNLYARRCLEGLKEYFPGRVIAYHEEPVELEGIEFRDFNKIKGWEEWLDRTKRHPGSEGQGSEGYDFRYDAQRFCRKVFVQDAVFDEDEYVFWIDADSIVKKPIPEEFLKDLFSGRPLAYLGRINSYTETGFVGFHTKHPEFAKFRAAYLPYITSGRLFSQLKGWHDCIAFDVAKNGLGKNLTPKGRNYDAVMEQSPLTDYLTHLKGQRKFQDLPAKISWA